MRCYIANDVANVRLGPSRSCRTPDRSLSATLLFSATSGASCITALQPLKTLAGHSQNFRAWRRHRHSRVERAGAESSALRDMLESRHVPPIRLGRYRFIGRYRARHMSSSAALRRLYCIGPQDRDQALFGALKARSVPLRHAEAIICTGLNDDRREKPEDYRGLLEEALTLRLPFRLCQSRLCRRRRRNAALLRRCDCRALCAHGRRRVLGRQAPPQLLRDRARQGRGASR